MQASVFLKRTFTRGLFRYVCHKFFKMFLYDFWKWKEIIDLKYFICIKKFHHKFINDCGTTRCPMDSFNYQAKIWLLNRHYRNQKLIFKPNWVVVKFIILSYIPKFISLQNFTWRELRIWLQPCRTAR